MSGEHFIYGNLFPELQPVKGYRLNAAGYHYFELNLLFFNINVQIKTIYLKFEAN